MTGPNVEELFSRAGKNAYQFLFFTANSLLPYPSVGGDEEFDQIYRAIPGLPFTHDFGVNVAHNVNGNSFLSKLKSEDLGEDHYSLIYFTRTSGKFNSEKSFFIGPQKNYKVKSKLIIKTLRKLNYRFLVLVLNGDQTLPLARTLSEYCDIVIGTNRSLKKIEAHQFARNFFDVLATHRVLYKSTVIDAFLQSAKDSVNEKGHSEQHAYVLLTKNVNLMSEDSLLSLGAVEIRCEEDAEKAAILAKLDSSMEKIKIEVDQLQCNNTHLKLINWLIDSRKDLLDQLLLRFNNYNDDFDDQEFKNILNKYFTIIIGVLRKNDINYLQSFKLPKITDSTLYREALLELDQLVPLIDPNGEFPEHSRHFLILIIRKLVY